MQHRHITDEIALVRNREFLFDVVPPLEDLYFAAQHNSQPDVPLPGFVHYFSLLRDTAFSKWFKQRKLMIVQLCESNAFGVSIKLFVVFWLASHMHTLRTTEHNPNLCHT